MEAGDVIAGRFVLEHEIGQGGLGVVWRAQQLGLGRPVAVKLLKAAGEQRRFETEARVLGRLKHPNCVLVHDFGRLDDGTMFIVMELLDGSDLAAHRGEQMPIERVLEIATEVAEALKYAHAQGVAHRDIKPENIFISSGGGVKLLDFGLAKLLGEGPAITETGECIGTAGYLSPEQARDTRRAGPASDQYALGVVMFELITGRRPFEGESAIQTCIAHMTEPPPPITRTDCPATLRRVVQRLLAKEPHARFPDCDALIRALNEIGSAGGDQRRPTPSTTPSSRGRRMVAIAAFLALVVVGSLAAWILLERATPSTVQAERRDVSALLRSRAPTPSPPASHAVETAEVAAGDAGRDAEAPLEENGARLPSLAVPPVRPSPGCKAERPSSATMRVPMKVGGLEREVLLQTPPSYEPSQPHPAIVALTYRRRGASEYVERGGIAEGARRAGYVVVAPEAIDPDFEPTKSPFEALKPTESLAPPHVAPWNEPSDMVFVYESVTRAADETCLDMNRIFAIGHAEGARMLQQMTCESSEFPFAAIVLTGFAAQVGKRCRQRHAVPTLRVAGIDDTFVPFVGGPGCAGAEFHSSARTDELWSGSHGCSNAAAEPWNVDDRCRVKECEKAPYVSCAVSGGHYLQQSHYNDPAAAGFTRALTDGLGDRKSNWFDPPSCGGSDILALDFGETVLPLFDHYARGE